jgi:hypothetical protein
MNLVVLERFGAILGVIFAARIWAKWRVSARQAKALTTPLVDAVLLESVFAPRAQDGDDADLLTEMRDTFLHLNRQAYAEEFWGLHAQLASLYATLGPVQQSTMRRALVRLVTVNDRWLQLVGAQTSATLGVTEAVNPLRALLEMGDTQRFNPDKQEYSKSETVDLRYRSELEQALAMLTDEKATSN